MLETTTAGILLTGCRPLIVQTPVPLLGQGCRLLGARSRADPWRDAARGRPVTRFLFSEMFRSKTVPTCFAPGLLRVRPLQSRPLRVPLLRALIITSIWRATPDKKRAVRREFWHNSLSHKMFKKDPVARRRILFCERTVCKWLILPLCQLQLVKNRTAGAASFSSRVVYPRALKFEKPASLACRNRR